MSKKITIPSILISILMAGLVAIGINQGSVSISGNLFKKLVPEN